MSLFEIRKRAFARERLAVTNGAVVSLTASLYDDVSDASPVPYAIGNPQRKASAAVLQVVEGSGALHFTEEGTAPTTGTTSADVGRTLNPLDMLALESYEALTKLKMIATTATNAIVEVVYYR